LNAVPKKRRRGRNAVTMHEVARHAGVSPMTVSRVLSGDAKVRAETRDRVRSAIEELDYSPNAAARHLAKASAVHVGLLYNNPSAAYMNELLVGVLEQSSQAACQVLLEKCEIRNERSGIEKLLADGVGGIILPPPLSDSKVALQTLRAAKTPFVAVATGRRVPDGLSVRINDYEAAAAMTRHLLALGHRDIGFIVGAPNQTASQERHAGFVAALAGEGIKPRPDWVKQGQFTYHSGLIATEQLLGGARRPSAIFASNDDMAAAAIAVAHRQRLEVPGDLTVVGFDDTPMATTIWPALTTIRQPVADMARKAIELLLQEIRLRATGGTLGPLQHIVDYSLIRRDSSAVPR
jgi:LacI family transcriptional regulator